MKVSKPRDITTVELKQTTKRRLNGLKNYLGAKSFDKVIEGMQKIISEYRIKKDIKDKFFTTKK